MGALRRPEPEFSEQSAPTPASTEAAGKTNRAYPRWLSFTGLFVYCAVFWVIIVVAGTWGVELVRTAAAGAH